MTEEKKNRIAMTLSDSVVIFKTDKEGEEAVEDAARKYLEKMLQTLVSYSGMVDEVKITRFVGGAPELRHVEAKISFDTCFYDPDKENEDGKSE